MNNRDYKAAYKLMFTILLSGLVPEISDPPPIPELKCFIPFFQAQLATANLIVKYKIMICILQLYDELFLWRASLNILLGLATIIGLLFYVLAHVVEPQQNRQ
jgi:hypothetical protein